MLRFTLLAAACTYAHGSFIHGMRVRHPTSSIRGTDIVANAADFLRLDQEQEAQAEDAAAAELSMMSDGWLAGALGTVPSTESAALSPLREAPRPRFRA